MQIYKRKDLPKKGDLVICDVKEIGDISVKVDLIEYENAVGIIPIDELSNRRIRNIREIVDIGKRVVCVVLNSDPNTRIITLSLKRVSEGQRKMKLYQFKREQTAFKILELLSEQTKISMDKIIKSIVDKIIQHGKLLYQVWEEAYIEGPGIFTKYKIPKKYHKQLYELIKSYFNVPKYERKGIISMYSLAPNGIDIIKEVLLKLKEIGIEIKYLGAPNYKFKISTYNPKTLNNIFKNMEKMLEEFSQKYNIDYEIIEE